MKLTYIHLALIVIGVLMLVNLGYSVKEGLESQGSYTKNDDDKNDDQNEKPDDEDSDKYILKSQIVPPVCPKCPDVTVCPNNNNNNNSSGFVPQPFANRDYNSQYNVAPGSGTGPLTAAYEPRPMLTDFSQF
jgi:hypothetical protein